MISDFKSYITQWFLQDVCYYEETFWGNFTLSKYNEKKQVYEFYLSPEIFKSYCTAEEHMYGYDYEDHVLDILRKLKELRIITDFYFNDLVDYEIDNYKDYDKRIFNSYQDVGWKYDIFFNREKIKLFEQIVYKTNTLKLNIKKQLLKVILYLIEKEQIDWPLNVWFKVFDSELLLDEVDIKDDLYVFEDAELLLYSLAINENKEYMAKLLDYLLKMINWSDRDILINAIKSDKIFSYYTDENIKNSRDAESYIQSNHAHDVSTETYDKVINDVLIGNIWYLKKSKIEEKKMIVSNNVEYNFDTKILVFNWKQAVFSGWWVQINFIEILYKNLNQCVPESEFKQVWVDSPMEKLKAIRTKLEIQHWINKFTGLETRTLISDFKYNWIKYFIMHW